MRGTVSAKAKCIMASLEVPMETKPVRSERRYAIAASTRPRGLWNHIMTLVLQPTLFFRSLGSADSGRQWLLAGILILALVGLSAVQQSQSVGQTAVPAVPVDVPPMSDSGMGGGMIDGSFGGFPADIPSGAGGVTGSASTTQVSATWSTALVAASTTLAGWLVVAVLLSEVTLLKGYAPRLGLNFRIAVWAGVPLGMMAALQLLFRAAGGEPGSVGLSGLLNEMPAYLELPAISQVLLLSLASQLTLFWVWGLLLIYKGARHALNGTRWSAALVVAAWVVVLVVVPVLTGAVRLPEKAEPGGPTPVEMFPGGPAIDAGELRDPGMVMPEGDVTSPAGESEMPPMEPAVPVPDSDGGA